MLDNERFLRARSELFWGRKFIEKVSEFPSLPQNQERERMKVCYSGLLLNLDDPILLSRELPMRIPYIEVTGMPKTGKTTLVNYASEKLTEFDIPHRIVRERKVPKDLQVYESGYNLSYFHQAVERLMRLHCKGPVTPVIMDRGVYNPIPFDYSWGDPNSDILVKFIEKYYGSFIDALIIMNATAESSKQRDSKLDERYLSNLSAAYKLLPRIIAGAHIPSLHPRDPKFIVEIDANKPIEDYTETFIRTIGSVMKHCLSGS